MSDSDWRQRDKVVTSLYFAFCGLVLVAAFYWSGNLAGYQEGRSVEARTQHEARAQQHVEEACVALTGAVLLECVYETAESTQESKRAEQDLQAQQGMERWAFWMAVLTFGTLLLTGAALWFIKGTLVETRKMVGETEELTGETVKATKAMVLQNKIAEQAQRPWLTLEILSIGPWSISKGDVVQLEYKIQIRNCGQSPALLARCAVIQEQTDSTGKKVDVEAFLDEAKPRNVAFDWFALGPGEVSVRERSAIFSNPIWLPHERGDYSSPSIMIGVVYQPHEGVREYYTALRLMLRTPLRKGEMQTERNISFYPMATLMT